MVKKANSKGRTEPVRAKPVDFPLRYIERLPGLTDPKAFALTVDGDCMLPKYRPGEILIFSPAAPVRSGDDCLVVYQHSTRGPCNLVKRVHLKPDGSIRLEMLNKAYEDFTVDARQVSAIIRCVAKVPASAVKYSGCPAPLERTRR